MSPLGSGHEARALAPRVAKGVRWSLLDLTLQQGMRFAVTITLARLIAPEDFGLLVMALVFSALAGLVGDLGLGPALVQRRSITQQHVSTAFVVTVVVGAALSLCLFLASGPIAGFYDQSDLQAVLIALSPVFLCRGLAGVPRDLLRRSMRFDQLALASIIAVALGGAVGIVMGIQGAGIWALSAQVVVETLASTCLALLLAWRTRAWSPGLSFDRQALRELVGFGAFVSGTRIASYAVTNIDNLIVGKILGPISLGLYNLAYRLMLFPILRVADVVANVTMPALASLQDEPLRVAPAFHKAAKYVAVLCFPASLGIAVAAPVLIPALFGANWTAAIGVTQVLALNGPRLALARLSGAVYEGMGKPAWDFAMLTITFAVCLPAFLIGVQWGIVGMAWSYTLSGYLLFPVDQYLVHRSMKASAVPLARSLVPVVMSTVIMCAVGASVLRLIPETTSDITSGAVVLLVCGISYAGALRVSAPGRLTEIWLLAAGRYGRRPD